ncbi:MAG: hypothetical protein DDT40_01033 [candidate division WS2 bacterium]|nr:hypothetical protein [Candidatus Psychracetigena formicireducens]
MVELLSNVNLGEAQNLKMLIWYLKHGISSE